MTYKILNYSKLAQILHQLFEQYLYHFLVSNITYAFNMFTN